MSCFRLPSVTFLYTQQKISLACKENKENECHCLDYQGKKCIDLTTGDRLLHVYITGTKLMSQFEKSKTKDLTLR